MGRAGFSTLASALVVAVLSATPAVSDGDPERGAEIWGQCASCHTVGPDARHRIGPHLNELFERPAAGLEDFRYSKPMRRAGADGLVWTVDKLDLFLENPKALVSGSRMSFRGIEDAEARQDLLAFLRQYSASPVDIPESAPTATPLDPDVDPAILAIAGDRDYGEYLASECITCHQADGAIRACPRSQAGRARISSSRCRLTR